MPFGAGTSARDVARLLAVRVVRRFASGAVSIVLVLFLAEAGFEPWRIGWLLTLALAGDAALSLAVSAWADRCGRRRTLVAGAVLFAATGAVFATSEGFVWLAAAATAGVLSPTGKDSGALLAVEQAALAECRPAAGRTRAFAWFEFAASLAGAAGALAAGWIAGGLETAGWPALPAYRAVFAGHAALGLVLVVLARGLSPAVEPSTRSGPGPATRRGLHRSRPTVVALAGLFAVDAFAGGLILQTVMAYWLALRFGASRPTIGTLVFGMGVLSACSAPASAWVAARLGLVRTMVYTHAPSNVLLTLLPWSPTFTWAAAVLLLRASVSQMDVPTRRSYVVGVVEPDERVAAAGLTSVARTLGATGGPAVTGLLLALWSGAPFAAAGVIKLVYDALVFRWFRHLEPPEERDGAGPRDVAR